MMFLATLFLLASVVGWLWICVAAFSEGETLWGIGSLLLPFVCVIYGIINFQELKIPLGLVLVGTVGRIISAVALVGA